MIEFLLEIDRQFFLFLNGLGHPYLDTFMIWMSDKYIWIPLYIFIIYSLYRKYGISFWKPLAVLIIGVAMADQITSGFMKPFFERFRPCRDVELEGLVVVIAGCGGKYGFASSHAANTMILAIFVNYIFQNSFSRWMFVWAVVTGYSRIYLGVHYPGDVLVGFFISLLSFFVLYWIFQKKLRWIKPDS